MSYESLIKRQSALTLAKLGFDGTQVEQGSPEWHVMRLGVITASRAKDLIATGRGGKGNGLARESYLLELVAEVATGQAKEQGEFKPTQWGQEHEHSARQIFAFHVGAPVLEAPFLYGDDSLRYGCSPDGIADDDSGIEIKCPWTTQVYLDFLLNGEIKPEYIDQVQFSMYVTGMPYWHFANYDPRMRKNSFHAITMERDEAKMKTFEDATGQMVHDIDALLAKAGFVFGEQWATDTQLRKVA